MSLLWDLALALQPTTEMRGFLIPLKESPKAETLNIDHELLWWKRDTVRDRERDRVCDREFIDGKRVSTPQKGIVMDEWMNRWVRLDSLPSLIFFVVKYNNKQSVFISETCLKLAYVF